MSLCDNCKKNQATRKITRIINGRASTLNLCDNCASKGISFNLPGPNQSRKSDKNKSHKSPFGLGGIFGDDLLGDLFGEMFNNQEPQTQERVDTESYISESGQMALQRAVGLAGRFRNDQVDTEHLLLALLDEPNVQKILEQAKVNIKNLEMDVKSSIKTGYEEPYQVEYSPRLKRALDIALPIAQNLRHTYVGPEHLLLALMEEGEGLAAQILKRLKLSQEVLQKAIVKTVGRGSKEGFVPMMNTPNLDQFSRDLSKVAAQGKLDPVIGRAKEIETIIEILARRTKNNPVLIGEPGVGKTAIVEGLAQRIVSGNVPEPLQGKRVVELDLSGILAGTQYRGQFEERLKGIVDEIRENSDKLVVFIDEIHLLVGAGRAEGTVMDAANMFKPALARGELHVVGATTLKEYQKYIEKDAALERRFQPVFVGEPSVKETAEILRGLRDRYESHHRVKISDEALIAAAELSHRYISNRFLPDKAIDLIDQAAARVRIQFTNEPEEIKNLESQVKNLEKELDASKRSKQTKRVAQLQKEITELKIQRDKLFEEWEAKKAKLTPEVTTANIAEIISKLTGIPITELTQEEKEKLLKLEERIHERLIGQEEAVKAVANAIRRGRAGMGDINRPIASFLFLGPTGVGKTELTRTLAQIMFSNEGSIVRLDMSEYMEKHNVSRLIGAPPGYVGFEEGGQLTEAVRRRPHSIILLDEIEKAHPDVFNSLLQVLEDGRLTDGQGRVIDFTNTIIIATSNAGSDIIYREADKPEEDRVSYESMKSTLINNLKSIFRPEFLNRIDEIIVFKALGEDEIRLIVSLQLDKLRRKLKSGGLELEVSRKAVDQLAKDGYDPHFGARELRRVIQKNVENRISEIILGKEPEKGSILYLDFDKEFKVQVKETIRN
ncbi:MAG: AAA family ATPase [Parcubacteria group bacterium]|nr:AAA family ATPase [Parcubacteria group bacterium]